jgi:colicin import membrane protein
VSAPGTSRVDTRDELVPLRTDFDLVWRGYDRDQVQQYIDAVEADLRLLTVDRDAAAAHAEAVAGELEAARTRIRELSERIDRICRSPIPPDALTERLRRMVELAHAEADEITTRARAAAEHNWETARQAADRLRQRHERLVAELDARRQQMEAEHSELMRRAGEQLEVVTRQAEQRRRDLDEQAARLREQVQTDFQVAMTARRAEALAEIAEQRAEARREADRLVAEATARADRIVADAEQRVALLENRRAQLDAALRATARLLADAEPLLSPLPDETRHIPDTDVSRPRLVRDLPLDDGGAAA